MTQVKRFHDELKFTPPECSCRWLYGEKASADHEAVDAYLAEVTKFAAE